MSHVSVSMLISSKNCSSQLRNVQLSGWVALKFCSWIQVAEDQPSCSNFIKLVKFRSKKWKRCNEQKIKNSPQRSSNGQETFHGSVQQKSPRLGGRMVHLWKAARGTASSAGWPAGKAPLWKWHDQPENGSMKIMNHRLYEWISWISLSFTWSLQYIIQLQLRFNAVCCGSLGKKKKRTSSSECQPSGGDMDQNQWEFEVPTFSSQEFRDGFKVYQLWPVV